MRWDTKKVLLALLLLWALAVRAWFASRDLSPARFWDERYGRENIEALLRTHSLAPANAYHPSLAFLPQALLLGAMHVGWRASGWPALQVLGDQGFTPAGYFACRLLQALFGTLSLWWVFRLGRRLFSPEVGLLGAFLLAATPWHIRQSAIFKPDILLLLLILIALEWSLRAARRGDLRSYLLAGVGIGLAQSSKYSGGAAALPLIAAALVAARRTPRKLLYLCAAGGTALALFALLNPFLILDPGSVAEDFGYTLRLYAHKGAKAGSSHLAVAGNAVASLMSSSFHGRVLGALGLAGLFALGVSAVRRLRRGEGGGVERLMLVAYPLGYTALYSLATINPSAHNWLPLAPFTALGAAWLIVFLWRRAALRWRTLNHRAAAGLAAGLLVAWSGTLAMRYAYGAAVPTVSDEVEGVLRQRLGAGLHTLPMRMVYCEPIEGLDLNLKTGAGRLAVVLPFDSRHAPEAGALDLSDAEVYGGDDAGERAKTRARASTGSEIALLAPRLFRMQGPVAAIVIHPWTMAQPPAAVRLEPASSAGAWTLQLPPAAPEERISFELLLGRGSAPPPRLLVDGRGVELFHAGSPHGARRFVSERIVARGGTVLLEGVPAGATAPRVRLYRWRRSDGAERPA